MRVRRHRRASLVAVLLAAGNRTASSANAPEAISPEDQQKIFADVREGLVGRSGISFPGVDLAKGRVTAVSADVELRKKWIDAMTSARNGDRAMKVWQNLRTNCQLKALPKVEIDLAVVTLFRIAEINSPLEFYAPGNLDMNDAENCREGPKGKAVIDLMQKVKVVRYTLSGKWPRQGDQFLEPCKGDKQFTVALDHDVLTIGVHSCGFNVHESWNAFVLPL